MNRTALSGFWVRAILYGCLALAGIAAIWVSNSFDRLVLYPHPDIALSVPSGGRLRGSGAKRPDWKSGGPVKILKPSPGAVLHDNKITVSGKAPREAMVGLYVNGEKVRAQLTPDGEWTFEDVPLTAKESILQARFFDKRGGSSFSKAIRISLVGRPAYIAGPEKVPALPRNPHIMRELCLTRASVRKKVVLLTFDGGGNDNATASILDTLKREHVHATMFLTGEYIRHYPDLVRRILAEGNTVGNHTFSHPHLTTYRFNGRQDTLPGVTGPFVQNQLRRANDLFRQVTGRNMAPYWRAPFGEYNRQILEWAALAGYRSVYWTEHLDTLDWVADRQSPLFHTPGNVLERLLARSKHAPFGINGGVILMHLGTERHGSSRIDLILPALIDKLKTEGYSFTTVDKTSWGKEPAPRATAFEAARAKPRPGGAPP